VNFDDAALIPASTEGDEEAKVEDDKLGTKPSSEALCWNDPYLDEKAHISRMKPIVEEERSAPTSRPDDSGEVSDKTGSANRKDPGLLLR
jgi:hypothetical protein